MKKTFIVLLFCIFALSTGCTAGKHLTPINEDTKSAGNISNPAGDTNLSTNNSKTPENKTDSANTASVKNNTMEIKIFLIAIDDNGKSGKKIETGDSLIPVKKVLPKSTTPLKDTLTLLLSLKDRNYGESGFYNALYQSNLKVESAKIDSGTAIINLSGNFKLGGEMDGPRVKAQIIESAKQFSTIKDVKVFINGKTLDEVLSLK